MESHNDDIFMSFDQSNDNKTDSNEELQHRQTNGHHEAYRTVTVSRINNEATSENLKEFFTQFGTVEKVRIATRVPKRKRQAFVTFSSRDSANLAFLNEPFTIKGKKVKVEPYRLEQDLDQSSGDNNRADVSNKNIRNGARGHNVSHKVYGTVYVGQIGKNITSKDLEEFFAKFGVVEKVTRKGARKAPKGKPLGFAFVTFSSKDSAHSAALAMFNEPSRIEGKIGNGKSDGGSHEACRTVHVARIQQNTNPKDLGEFFTQFGAVEKVSIVTMNSNGKPQTNAFVTFASQDSADSAVLDESHTIKGEKVNVIYCTLKENQDQDNGGYRADSNEDWPQSHQASIQDNEACKTAYVARIRKTEDKISGDMVVEAENRSPPFMETPNLNPSMDMV